MKNKTHKPNFQIFIDENRLKKTDIARYLGVSNAFVTQLYQGQRDIPEDKFALIKANPNWDISMFEVDKGNISTVSGSNNTSVAGDGNQVTTNDLSGMIELQKGYQEMIKEKDSQIDRLISVIEKLSENR